VDAHLHRIRAVDVRAARSTGSRHERLPGIWTQFTIQLEAVCWVFAWTAVVAFIAFYIVKRLVGLRVAEEEERDVLDITSHGERAYDL
jgi:Amt family ammonium transporter